MLRLNTTILSQAYCTLSACLVAPSYYNKYMPPKPYLARAYDLNMTNPECLWDYNTDTVVVDVQLPIMQVTEISLSDHGGSISFEGGFSIAWADPELTSCICSPWETKDASGMWWERFDDYISSVVMGGGLEGFVWVPDIHIWHGTKVTRWRGTTPLVDIIYRPEPGCPPEITLEFDARFSVDCSVNLEWFPFDKNACHIQVGSGSFSQKDVIIRMSGGGYALSSWDLHEFTLHFRPLCHHLRQESVQTPGPGGREEIFMTDGFTVIIERKPDHVLNNHLPFLIGLSLVALLQYGIPHNHNRVQLLVALLVSFMLHMSYTLQNTPRVVHGFHYLLSYAYYSTLFIMFAFCQHCIVLYLERLSPRVFNDKFIRCIDLTSLILHATIYLVFNIIYWFYNPFFPASDVCHNEDRFDLDCET